MTRLEKTLPIDEDGNITARNDLEAEGTTKLNGGLKPIHSYVFSDTNGQNYPFDVYVEVQTNPNQFSFLGKYSGSLCFGIYTFENGEVSELRVMYLNDPSENPYILHGDNFSGNDTTDQAIQTLP